MMKRNRTLKEVQLALDSLQGQLDFLHEVYFEKIFKQKETDYHNLLQSIIQENAKIHAIKEKV